MSVNSSTGRSRDSQNPPIVLLVRYPKEFSPSCLSLSIVLLSKNRSRQFDGEVADEPERERERIVNESFDQSLFSEFLEGEEGEEENKVELEQG